MSQAIRCPCGSPGCHNWLVAPEAALQGVCFTQAQAEAVAELLNKIAPRVSETVGGGSQESQP